MTYDDPPLVSDAENCRQDNKDEEEGRADCVVETLVDDVILQPRFQCQHHNQDDEQVCLCRGLQHVVLDMAEWERADVRGKKHKAGREARANLQHAPLLHNC